MKELKEQDIAPVEGWDKFREAQAEEWRDIFQRIQRREERDVKNTSVCCWDEKETNGFLSRG